MGLEPGIYLERNGERFDVPAVDLRSVTLVHISAVRKFQPV